MKKPPKDPNRSAKHVLDTLTKPKNDAAVALGRLGGLKGGKARAEKLTAEQRKAIAKKGADKRWGKD